MGWDNFVIIDEETSQAIGELDWRAAHTMLHEQAIYQQDAEQYQVERLDFDNHKAFVRKVTPDYFTTALTYRRVSILEPASEETRGEAPVGWGEVKVVEKVTGYKKIKFFTHENAGYGDVHLPEMEMHTTAFWLTIPEPIVEALRVPRAMAVDALRGLGAALETVASLALMCDRRDLGQSVGDGEAEQESAASPHAAPVGAPPVLEPRLFLFDALPGGVGLAPRIFERVGELLERARQLVERCPCERGCPACVGPVEGPRKELTLRLIDALGVPVEGPERAPRFLRGEARTGATAPAGA